MAYRAKYQRYGANILGTVLTPQARSATLIEALRGDI